MGRFEVSKELVAGLDDVQLRALLERLLVAEANLRGISHFAIAVGGNRQRLIAAGVLRSDGRTCQSRPTGCRGG